MATRCLPLSPEQEQALTRLALDHPQENVRQRALTLLLLHHGHAVTAVARQLGIARRSVYYWIDRYIAYGVEGMDDLPRPGRPTPVTEEYRERLQFLLSCDPWDFHTEFPSYTKLSGWTTRRLSQHLETDTGIAVSLKPLRQLLKAFGYHYGAKRVIRVTRHFVSSMLLAHWLKGHWNFGDIHCHDRE